jgi:dihydrodipicolinate synthase/N-acetylneuraminate lyase
MNRSVTRYPQAILVSCEIPWDEDEQLLEGVFRRELRHVLTHFRHLYIFGTAGEGYAVDSAGFQRIVEIFYEETRGDDVHPMVGVIALSTANVVERLAFAYAMGFRTFQISLPAWGRLNDHELLTFFADVCGAFPDARFLHYNLPRAQRVLTGPEYRMLVDRVPNLVATKNTGGGQARASDLMKHAPELQHFFGEANFPFGRMEGECSLLSSLGPMTPAKVRAFFEATCAERWEESLHLQKGLHDLLHGVLGPLLEKPYIDGAYDKVLKRLGGFDEMPLRLLSPYQGVCEEEYQVCRTILHTRFTDWVANGAT